MTRSRGLIAPRGARAAWVEAEQDRHLCECGCGEPVRLRPEQYPTPPRFLWGHNGRDTKRRKELPPPLACECGCGELANSGKRFLPGHNSSGRRLSAESRRKIAASRVGDKNPMYGKPAVNRKEPRESTPCGCGCGDLATPGRMFIAGHNGRGQRQSNYTGRFLNTRSGYAFVDAPDHPYAQKGYVAEHRLVVERHLRESEPGSEWLVVIGERLYLSPDAVVHHINGVKDDNRLRNLQPMSRYEHTRLHHDQGDIHSR